MLLCSDCLDCRSPRDRNRNPDKFIHVDKGDNIASWKRKPCLPLKVKPSHLVPSNFASLQYPNKGGTVMELFIGAMKPHRVLEEDGDKAGLLNGRRKVSKSGPLSLKPILVTPA